MYPNTTGCCCSTSYHGDRRLVQNVVHDGKVITDLTQTYRQLRIQASAHVQLQSWDPENPPVVPTLEEVEEIKKTIESLIQELQGVEQGNEDSDPKSETKEPTEDQNVWSTVRHILWRHLELRDGDPDIPLGALKMLIRAVGENTVAGEVLQTILEAALERQGEGGTERQGEGGTERQGEGVWSGRLRSSRSGRGRGARSSRGRGESHINAAGSIPSKTGERVLKKQRTK
ncbi:hypothetical protein Bbelb_154230 [Branchiostoma belcheri]|nr:hypothetical protein Bbelb_154230 [Branchiostoma belcheri]